MAEDDHIEGFLKEINGHSHPVQMAILVTGMMAGVICKHAGSNEYMAIMRMVVAIFDQYEGKETMKDDEAVVALMAKLREHYYQRREANERQDA
ncbi:hypothetical protein GOC14_07040 [Sinorhizobium meliloti]|nr:hypothetical protein [Sinorhizobium meliloti]